MTFTYAGTLVTDLDYIRFQINDKVASSGPLPTGANFTDEEINGLLTIEGTKQRTVAALFEMLASTWSRYVDTAIGPRDEKLSKIADSYFKLAKQWRDDYGYGTSASMLYTGFVTRQDGYSDDIDSGES
jgi:hypothetical protein